LLEDSSFRNGAAVNGRAVLEYKPSGPRQHRQVPAVCSQFSAENPQVLHILGQRFSTKDQNEKIRMTAAEQKRELATAEPLLAGFAVSCMK
jgi:hypothetical protein